MKPEMHVPEVHSTFKLPKQATPFQLKRIYEVSDDEIILEIAKHISTPSNLLEQIWRENRGHELMIAIAQNTNTPLRILLMLTGSMYVAEVNKNPFFTEHFYLYNMDAVRPEDVFKELCEEDHIYNMCQHIHLLFFIEYCIKQLYNNAKTQEDLEMAKIQFEDHYLNLFHISRDITTSIEVLTHLSTSKNITIRKNVARNPSSIASILINISKDEIEIIGKQAKERLEIITSLSQA